MDRIRPPTSRPVTTWLLVAIVIGLALVVGAVMGFVRIPFLDVHADMAVEESLVGRHLNVTGSTSLIDGSSLICETWHHKEDNDAGTGAFVADANATVAGGRFSCSFDLTGWPSGLIHLAVRFEPYQPDQPEAVTKRYGSNGERLAGPLVVDTSDGRSIEVLKDLTLT